MFLVGMHFVKCVRVWGFSGPNAGKYGPKKFRIIPNTVTFHAVMEKDQWHEMG